jgi:hypothetical protein
VNLTGENKNFKMLEFLLNQLQTYYVYLCDLLSFMWRMYLFFSDFNYKMVIFLSQPESTPRHFLKKESTGEVCCTRIGVGLVSPIPVQVAVEPQPARSQHTSCARNYTK